MNNPQITIPPILAALVVAIFPHIGRLPLWIVLWCAIMWGYVLLSFRLGWPRPGKKLRIMLAIIGISGLLITFTRRLDQDAYLGLLAVMAALKPFEMESHRDRMITVFLAYFIVITSLFLSETLLMTLYMFVSVGVTTAVLIRINDPGGRLTENIKLSGVIMAQAVPLMILLFFLFPRIEGSLFGLWFSGTAKSGFSESMAPGSVAMLVENDDVAFRAMFDGGVPPLSLLYWRGIVFSEFDGRKWHAQRYISMGDPVSEGRDPVSYTVTLEPHNDRWLFVLEMPSTNPPSADFLADYTLRARYSVRRQMRYQMTSHTRYLTGPEEREYLEQLTRLPEEINPGARRLAAELTSDAATTVEKVHRLMTFFRDGGFVYTLTPPRLGRHSVDDFLFSSRRGYCEHYAAAFAFMMRSIGVPARVVGGYLGGEVNPFADYLIVRQSDAHVWVEIWDTDAGWVRADPTAAVSPERISEGMRSALSAGESAGFFQRGYFGGLADFIRRVRLGWDALNMGWRAFFEGYSYDVQQALLARMGIRPGVLSAALKAVLLMLALSGVIIGAYVWFTLHPARRRLDPVEKYYIRFCDKLARIGLPRKPDQGPLDYKSYLLANRPDLEREIAAITDLYVKLRYRGEAFADELPAFVAKVRAFDPATG